MEQVGALVKDAMLTIFCFLFLFVGLGARLLPTWMFLNSLQLIVHTPLIAAYMPANLNYFLIQLLGIARLSSKKIDEAIETWQWEEGFQNYELSGDNSSAFSHLLNDCGYKHTFMRNLVIIDFLGMTFFIILAILYCMEAWQVKKYHRSK